MNPVCRRSTECEAVEKPVVAFLVAPRTCESEEGVSPRRGGERKGAGAENARKCWNEGCESTLAILQRYREFWWPFACPRWPKYWAPGARFGIPHTRGSARRARVRVQRPPSSPTRRRTHRAFGFVQREHHGTRVHHDLPFLRFQRLAFRSGSRDGDGHDCSRGEDTRDVSS